MADGQGTDNQQKSNGRGLRIIFTTAAGAGVAALGVSANTLMAGTFNAEAVGYVSVFAGLGSAIVAGLYENHIMPRVARNWYKQPDSEGPGW